MTVKPIFSHGLAVTELPGIAGWIDNLLALVFEQTLVEPNMLVVDVEKFASPQSENWFSVDAKEPIAHDIVEVLEASEMKPSDLNGLADPYVKGRLGPYRFQTNTQKKTLTLKWREEFRIPICSWESENTLLIEVRDKDRIFDDTIGECCVDINEHRDGQRHDIWFPLQNIKMGRLHLVVTESDGSGKVEEPSLDTEILDSDLNKFPLTDDSAQKDSFTEKLSEKSPKVADKFDPIKIEGKPDIRIWIHHPGSETAQVWEPRKGKMRHKNRHHLNGLVQGDGSSTYEESTDLTTPSKVQRGFRKISSIFCRSPKDEDKSSPREPMSSLRNNIRASNAEEVGIRWVTDDTAIPPSLKVLKYVEKEVDDGNGPGSPQAHVKDMANSILKQARKSARSLKIALSQKVLRKSRGESTDKDGSCRDRSDDDSSLSGPVGPGLVIPGATICSEASVPDDNISFNSGDNNMVPADKSFGNNSLNSVDATIKGPA